MIKIKSLPAAVLFILASSAYTLAQQAETGQNILLVREDKVLPSNVSAYEAALADLQIILNEANDQKINYFCHMQDDYCFTHVIPVTSLEDIENLKIHKLVNRLGTPELNLVYDDINSSIESTKYYMLRYHPELSYIPETEDWMEQLPYRRWSFYYFFPGTGDEAVKILAAWKELYIRKGIDRGFRVFEGYMGTEQPLFILGNWARNPADHQEKLNQIMKLLGEEGTALWMATMELVKEVRIIEGWYLPQYSYTLGRKFAE